MSELMWLIVGCWVFCGVLGWALIEFWPNFPKLPITIFGWPNFGYLPLACLVGPVVLIAATDHIDDVLRRTRRK